MKEDYGFMLRALNDLIVQVASLQNFVVDEFYNLAPDSNILSSEQIKKNLNDKLYKFTEEYKKSYKDKCELEWDENNSFSVVDRPAENNDLVTASLLAVDSKTGKGIRKVDEFSFSLNSQFAIPKLKNGIIGMNVGEEKKILISFNSGFHDLEFAGKEIEFTVRLLKVKQRKKNIGVQNVNQ